MKGTWLKSMKVRMQWNAKDVEIKNREGKDLKELKTTAGMD